MAPLACSGRAPLEAEHTFKCHNPFARQVDAANVRPADWERLRAGIALKTFTALIKQYQVRSSDIRTPRRAAPLASAPLAPRRRVLQGVCEVRATPHALASSRPTFTDAHANTKRRT